MIWNLELRSIEDLKEFPQNARIMTKEQSKQLKRNIDKFGLIDKPIINSDNMIIGGHQRLSIIRSMGHKQTECWVPDRALTPEEIDELNISLNLHTGEWDWNKLANEWDVDLLVMLGFDPKEFFDCPEKKVTKPKVTFEFNNKQELDHAMEDLNGIQSKFQCKIKLKI